MLTWHTRKATSASLTKTAPSPSTALSPHLHHRTTRAQHSICSSQQGCVSTETILPQVQTEPSCPLTENSYHTSASPLPAPLSSCHPACSQQPLSLISGSRGSPTSTTISDLSSSAHNRPQGINSSHAHPTPSGHSDSHTSLPTLRGAPTVFNAECDPAALTVPAEASVAPRLHGPSTLGSFGISVGPSSGGKDDPVIDADSGSSSGHMETALPQQLQGLNAACDGNGTCSDGAGPRCSVVEGANGCRTAEELCMLVERETGLNGHDALFIMERFCDMMGLQASVSADAAFDSSGAGNRTAPNEESSSNQCSIMLVIIKLSKNSKHQSRGLLPLTVERTLVKALRKTMRTFTSKDLVRTCFCLLALRCAPHAPFISTVAKCAQQKGHEWSEQEFASVLYALANMGHRTPALLRLLSSVPRHLCSLSTMAPAEVPSLLKAMQQLVQGSGTEWARLHRWWSRTCWVLSQRLDQFDSHSLAALLHSVLSWSPIPGTAVTLFLRSVPVLCGMLDRNEIPLSRLSLVLHTCAANSMYHTGLWQRACRYILSVESWESVPVRDVADLIWVMGRSRHWDAALMGRLCSAAAKKLQDMTPRQLALMVWSLAKLRYRHSEGFVRRVQAAIMTSVQEDSLRLLTVGTAGSEKSAQWLVKDISQVLWSLPVLGTISPDMFKTLLVHLELRLGVDNGQNVPTTSLPSSVSHTSSDHVQASRQPPLSLQAHAIAPTDDATGMFFRAAEGLDHNVKGDSLSSVGSSTPAALDVSMRTLRGNLSKSGTRSHMNGHAVHMSCGSTAAGSTSPSDDIQDVQCRAGLDPGSTSCPTDIHIAAWDHHVPARIPSHPQASYVIEHCESTYGAHQNLHVGREESASMDGLVMQHVADSDGMTTRNGPSVLSASDVKLSHHVDTEGRPRVNGLRLSQRADSDVATLVNGVSVTQHPQQSGSSTFVNGISYHGHDANLSQPNLSQSFLLQTNDGDPSAMSDTISHMPDRPSMHSSVPASPMSMLTHLHGPMQSVWAGSDTLPTPPTNSPHASAPLSRAAWGAVHTLHTHTDGACGMTMDFNPEHASCMEQEEVHALHVSLNHLPPYPLAQEQSFALRQSMVNPHNGSMQNADSLDDAAQHIDPRPADVHHAFTLQSAMLHAYSHSTQAIASSSQADSASSLSSSLGADRSEQPAAGLERLSPVDARQLFHAGMIMAVNQLVPSSTCGNTSSTATRASGTTAVHKQYAGGKRRYVQSGDVKLSPKPVRVAASISTPASSLHGPMPSIPVHHTSSQGLMPSNPVDQTLLQGLIPSSPTQQSTPHTLPTHVTSDGDTLADRYDRSRAEELTSGYSPADRGNHDSNHWASRISLTPLTLQENGMAADTVMQGSPAHLGPLEGCCGQEAIRGAPGMSVSPEQPSRLHSLESMCSTGESLNGVARLPACDSTRWTAEPPEDVGRLRADRTKTSMAKAVEGGSPSAEAELIVPIRAVEQPQEAARDAEAAQECVFDPARMLPGLHPEIIKVSRVQWRTAAFRRSQQSPPALLQEVCHVLQLAGIQYRRRVPSLSGLLCVDLLIQMEDGLHVAVLADGPAQYSRNEPYRLLGDAICNRRMLQAEGYHLLLVPFYMWRVLGNFDKKQKWLMQQLEEVREAHTVQEWTEGRA